MSNPDSNPNQDPVEVMETNSVESPDPRAIRCLKNWQRKLDRFLAWIGFREMIFGILISLFIDNVVLKDNGACQTSDCISSASQIRNAINSSTEPCNDFYEFACGNSKFSPFLLDAVSVDMKLKSIIEVEIDADEPRAFQLVKRFYKSCMNHDEIEALGLQQFDKIVRRIGGWPIVEGKKWNEADFDWTKSIRQMRNIGLTTMYLFDTKTERIFKYSSIQSLVISQPEFKLPRELLLDDSETMFQKYYQSMIDIAEIFGANLNSFALHEIADLLILERNLANISLPAEELRDFFQFISFNVFELYVKYPLIKWIDYFNALMPTDMKITLDKTVIVRTPGYFDRLAEILQKTSKRTIANYFVWRILLESSTYLNKRIRERTNQFVDSISNEEKWFDCIKITKSALSPAVGALYVQKLANENSKQHAKQIVESIRSSFIDMLNNVTWMDENTKKAALGKAKAIVAHIDSPNELTNNTKLDQYYESLALNESEFFMNALRINKFEMNYNFRQLYKSVDNDDWLRCQMPATIEAFFNKQKNQILLPAAILQGSFLSDARPNYLNYGAIGQIIGHEFTHGFDDQGIKFDLNGNVMDWWMPETKVKFLNKIKCIIEQYGNFTEPNFKMNVNGKLTRNENIADNGGMKSAYYAYAKWMERNNAEPHLPGLKGYTSKQMFWISAAQIWCSRIDDSLAKYLMTTDVHSPRRFRVIGPMRNSKEFATDFNCAPGTPMNPVEKCEIW